MPNFWTLAEPLALKDGHWIHGQCLVTVICDKKGSSKVFREIVTYLFCRDAQSVRDVVTGPAKPIELAIEALSRAISHLL